MSAFSPEVRRGGGLPFGQIVSQWVCDPRYTTNLRTLYAILVTYADIGSRDTKKGKPYRRHLAAQMGVSVKTLDRTVEEGEAAGILWVEERQDPDNPRLNEANIYHLRDSDFWNGEWTDPLQPGQTAASVAEALRAQRVEAKRAAGQLPKGGRKKKEEGVASPMTPPPPGGGGVTHDALYLDQVEENPCRETNVRPSVPAGGERTRKGRTEGRTDGGDVNGVEQQTPTAGSGEGPAVADATPGTDKGAATRGVTGAGTTARAVETTPGVDLLIRMGQRVPRLAISGKVLMDQGRRVNELIAAGWERQALLDVLSAPFTDEIRTSAGAVVAGRISLLPTAPYRAARWVPEQSAGDTPPAQDDEHRRDSVAAAAWTVEERKRQIEAASAGNGITRNCEADSGACDRLAAVGHDACGAHLGWSPCEGDCGRFAPGQAPTCEICQDGVAFREMIRREAERPPAEPCPGHQGTGCERGGEVQTTTGLCFRCESAAAMERKQAQEAEWERARAEAVAAATAAEAKEAASAPF